jgi:hypothetical protein
MIADLKDDHMVELDFSTSESLTGADRTALAIAGGLYQIADTFRAVAPTQASPAAAAHARHAATVLEVLADEAWNLVGSGASPGAQFALRQLGRSTTRAIAALQRGASPDVVAQAMSAYFANLHSALDRLEATAERRLRAALDAFRASASLAEPEVALHQPSLQPGGHIGYCIEFGNADLYRNVHSLISAALAPPTFLPNDDTPFVGRNGASTG